MEENNVTDVFEQVRVFHYTYGQPVKVNCELPSEDRRELRRRLMQEEYQELLRAEYYDDLVEIADALADIIYIACGTALEYGIPLRDVFNIVKASNMSKLDENGKPIVREDGKILKGPNYFAPSDRIRQLLISVGATFGPASV